MEHELKGIRYQSEKYAKLTTLINRVNEESLKEAHQRQKTGKAVRRTYIPKPNGKTRPLGIPAYEDRLIQSVMAEILSDVYEPRFLNRS